MIVPAHLHSIGSETCRPAETAYCGRKKSLKGRSLSYGKSVVKYLVRRRIKDDTMLCQMRPGLEITT